MTKVEIIKEKGHIKSITATGHADYSIRGSDIVCAGISTSLQQIILTLKNEIDEKAYRYKIDNDGLIEIEILESNYVINALMNSCFYALESLEKVYPNNIKLFIENIDK